jgi:hypothetical protein
VQRAHGALDEAQAAEQAVVGVGRLREDDDVAHRLATQVPARAEEGRPRCGSVTSPEVLAPSATVPARRRPAATRPPTPRCCRARLAHGGARHRLAHGVRGPAPPCAPNRDARAPRPSPAHVRARGGARAPTAGRTDSRSAAGARSGPRACCLPGPARAGRPAAGRARAGTPLRRAAHGQRQPRASESAQPRASLRRRGDSLRSLAMRRLSSASRASASLSRAERADGPPSASRSSRALRRAAAARPLCCGALVDVACARTARAQRAPRPVPAGTRRSSPRPRDRRARAPLPERRASGRAPRRARAAWPRNAPRRRPSRDPRCRSPSRGAVRSSRARPARCREAAAALVDAAPQIVHAHAGVHERLPHVAEHVPTCIPRPPDASSLVRNDSRRPSNMGSRRNAHAPPADAGGPVGGEETYGPADTRRMERHRHRAVRTPTADERARSTARGRSPKQGIRSARARAARGLGSSRRAGPSETPAQLARW